MNQTRRKNPPCRPGDMLLIPYGEGTIYGRVVYDDAPDAPKAQRRGLYMTVLDREAAGGADLAEVAAAPVLLGPLFTTDEPVKRKEWPVVGHVPLTPAEQELPYFVGSRGLVDYFHRPVPETPENEARVVAEYVAPPQWVVSAVRAKRGLEPWQRGYDCMLPKEVAQDGVG